MSSSSGGRRTQAERRATTRAALVGACIEALRAGGMAEVTVANVSRRAGVSQGALFHYFATLDELILTAIEEHFTGWEAQSLAPLADLAEPEDRIAAAVDAVWAKSQEADAALALELNVAARTDPAIAALLRRVDERGAVLHLDAAADLFADLHLDRAALTAVVDIVVYGVQGLALANLHGLDDAEIVRVLDALKRAAVALAASHRVDP